MFPSTRGHAGIAALVVAAVFLLVAVWLGFGAEDPQLTKSLAVLDEAGEPGLDGPEARSLLDRVDALSKRLDRQVINVPEGATLAVHGGREPEKEPPGVDGLTGRMDDSHIVLRWRATGEESPKGFRVVRIGPDDQVIATGETGPDVLQWRDGPVNELRGQRIYRVTVIDGNDNVAGLQQKTVPFRVDFEVEFLGPRVDGAGRFQITWERAGTRIVEEFAAAMGDEIGGPVPRKEDRPALDMRTGWRFTGYTGRRIVETRETRVPRFTPEGLLARDPETGKAVFEVRKMPVARVLEGAEVERPREDGGTGRLWLQKAKD